MIEERRFLKAPPHVLVVDDDSFMLTLITQTLHSIGIAEVSTASGAREALGLLDGTQPLPDVILCDLQMPEIDGVELIRHLVERHFRGGLIPISGEDERTLAAVGALARAHGFRVLGCLRKPLDPDALNGLLLEWPSLSVPQGDGQAKAYDAEAIKMGLERDEFVNYYQPKVRVATGKVAGAEALARWQHPRDGLIPPGRFIDVAEENGLIDALTIGVLRRGMRQAAAWDRLGLQMKVSLNLSMENLHSTEFADLVGELAAEAGVSPQRIILEVTESRLPLNPCTSMEVLTRLRLKGFNLSIDDFGTGHSSLVQLRDFPFNKLKIDRGFVHGADRDETVRAIYKASLHMARLLNMEVTAEGVEDGDDWNLLSRTGCDLAQGYFVARPMPAEAIPDWISQWQEKSP